MTTIAAVTNGKRSWIGADRCVSIGDVRRYNSDKLIRCGRFVFGCAGSSKAKDILRARASKLKKARSIFEFVGAVHSILFDHEFKMRGDYLTEDCIGHLDMLVATADALFVVSDGMRITTPKNYTLAAIGSGCEFAVGAGNSILRYGGGKPGEDVVRAAIIEACRWDPSSGGEPVVMEVK